MTALVVIFVVSAPNGDTARDQKTEADLVTLAQRLENDIDRGTARQKQLYLAVLYQAKQFGKGIAFYKKHFTDEPPGFALEFLYYRLLKANGKDKEARVTLQKLYRQHPFLEGRLRYELGTIMTEACWADDAFATAIQADPLFATPYLARAKLLVRRSHERDLGLRFAAAALSLAEPDTQLRTESIALIVEYCEAAKDKPPDDKNPTELATLKALEERVGKDLAKRTPEVNELYLAILYQTKQFDKAIAFYKKHFKHDERGFSVDFLYYRSLKAAGDDKEASRALAKLYGKHPRLRGRLLYELGMMWKPSGEPWDQVLFEAAIDADPLFVPPYLELARRVANRRDERDEVLRFAAPALALVEPDTRLAKEIIALIVKHYELPKDKK